jgi:hypothetical protein
MLRRRLICYLCVLISRTLGGSRVAVEALRAMIFANSFQMTVDEEHQRLRKVHP